KRKTLTQEALPIRWKKQYNPRQDIEETWFANMANMVEEDEWSKAL
ncbi:9205_t:CDS:1, partial [Gigaspora rosea]